MANEYYNTEDPANINAILDLLRQEQQEAHQIVNENLERAVNQHSWIDGVDNFMSFFQGLNYGQQCIIGIAATITTGFTLYITYKFLIKKK
jgi:hypothetical protein